jgi:hypothetical protein
MKKLARDCHFYTRLMKGAASSRTRKVIAPLEVVNPEP